MATPVDQASFAELITRFQALLDRWDQDGGSGLTLAAVQALTDAITIYGNETVPATQTDSQGNARLVELPLGMFASRRTQDLAGPVRQIGDEIIPSWSAQRMKALGDGSASLSVGEIAAGILGALNPKTSYGAKGDGKYVEDASTTAGSNVVESQDGQFAATDVGKLVFLSNGAANAKSLASTITGFQDAKHVTIADAANTTRGAQRCLWGTDDTAPIQTWLDALAGSGAYSFGRAGIAPEGIFLIQPSLYGPRMAIRGSGQGATVFALIPGGNATRAVLQNRNNQVDFPIIQDITILGMKYFNPNANGGLYFISVPGTQNLPQVDPYPRFSNITIREAQGIGFRHYGKGAGRVQNLDVRECGYYGMFSDGYDMTYSGILTAGNRFTGIFFSNNGSSTNSLDDWYSYFNVSDPYKQNLGANFTKDPVTGYNWCDIANLYVGGTGQHIGLGRAQESWGPNVVVDGVQHFLSGFTCDDTGCVYPRHKQGQAILPAIRPALLFAGATSLRSLVTNVYVNDVVHPNDTYATHLAYFVDGADQNRLNIAQQLGMAAFYGSGSGAYAPGQIGTDNAQGSYRQNVVTVNDTRLVG